MTDEIVMSIGRMVDGLSLLTNLTIDMSYQQLLSDRSMKVISECISHLESLTHLNLTSISIYHNGVLTNRI
jgi:uncharacterized alkaline shock family protein YloU